MSAFRYKAFISYSHDDEQTARWLHRRLETYRLPKQFVASMGRVEVTNIIADGDYVVVEQQAKDRMTKTGKPYNNTYCMVYKVVDGEVKQLTEYCDTALAKSIFG